METSYDVIVVGAGSSGCALAARLSENDARQVLLLEAGPDYRTVEDFPPEVARARSMAAAFPGHPNSWNFVGELFPGRPYPLARGKIVGGSSSINGTYFIRARPEDFEEWESVGGDLWSYNQVLPFFKRSENDLDFDDDAHGQAGPMPVNRPRPDQLRPVSEAFIESCLDLGFPEEPDKNSPGPDGVGPVPRNVVDGIRMNTAVTYLAPARNRPNLTVLGNTLVRRVVFEGARAVGVEAETHGRPISFRADQTILSAGGIKTPHLLMLSGIGPAEMLRRHGISVIRDSPGVGRNIKDHPDVHVNFRVKDDRVPLPDDFMVFQTCLNYTAPGSTDVSDLQITCGAASFSATLRAVPTGSGRRGRLPSYLKRPRATLSALSKLPARLVVSQARMQDNLVLLVCLHGERSTGEISLGSADPTDPPRVNLNYLSHADDMARLSSNLLLAVKVLQSPGFARLGIERISPSDDDLASDDSTQRWIKSHLGTAFHTFNSTHMGPTSDPTAVVDARCRVHGVEGLRVADTSIIPSIHRGPAATAVMIGERVAALIDDDR
jgi:choline dehydrogenase